ncbi:hypothetical protein NMG60_11018795 [Bertholletia excelsa]
MVEVSCNCLMISPCPSRGISVASASSFGSCKEGWYYRCLGLDP